MSDVTQNFEQALKRGSWLDRAAEPVQGAVHSVYGSMGAAGRKIMDFMHGVWLGHPLHPVLTDVPIGAWTAAVALDVMEATSGSRGVGKAADAAIGLGVAGAGAAAVTGITDWMHLVGESRRAGFLHALLNTTALAFYISSLVARKARNRGLGRLLALTGYSIAGFSAYIGGDLVYRQKIGVNHAPKEIKTDGFITAISLADLPEGQLTRATANGTPIVLLRRGQQVFALAESCAHLGGPLSEGDLGFTEEGQPTVTCPWHGSRFNLATGDVMDGPSAYPQPCMDTRVVNGQVEVRSVHQE